MIDSQSIIKASGTKIKLLMLGDSGVGKSSILQRFVDEKFTPNFFATLGVEYRQKKMTLPNKNEVLVQIWDTAGQERFKTITPVYYKSVDGVVLVYDIHDEQSFENVQYWLDNLNEFADKTKISIIMAANKTDLPNRKIEKLQGEEMAKKCQMNMYETSAKQNLNITNLFNDIVNQIVERKKINPEEADQELQKSKSSVLKQQEPKPNKQKCCE